MKRENLIPDYRPGADAFRQLCRDVGAIVDAHDHDDWPSIVDAVRTSLSANLQDYSSVHATGYLRALAELVATNAINFGLHVRDPKWDPIAGTEPWPATDHGDDGAVQPGESGQKRDGARDAPLEHEVSNLRDQIYWIDSLTQEGDSTIEALAKGAQAVLQAGGDIVAVHRLLGTIVEVSANYMNLVSCEAERAGANCLPDNDPSELAEGMVRRRWRVETEVEA